MLYDQADAFEAFDMLIGVLHAWSLPTSQEKDLFKLVKKACSNCFAHESFY